MGPLPDAYITQYAPWRTQVGTFLCPSHPAPAVAPENGKTNYAPCFGDNYHMIGGGLNVGGTTPNRDGPGGKRGIFGPLQGAVWSSTSPVRGYMGLRDCLDGSATTIAMGEVCHSTNRAEVVGNMAQFASVGSPNTTAWITNCMNNAPNPTRPQFYNTTGFTLRNDLKGWMYADSHWARGIVNTIFPPNGLSCRSDGTGPHVANSVGSYHQGGAHVIMCDGAVRFVSENVESVSASSGPTVCEENGNLGQESPYGVWGAAGTRAGSENKSL